MSAAASLAAALADLDALESAGLAALQSAANPDAVEAARVEFLGQKQGKIKAAQERMKAIPPAEKKAYGQRFNAVKQALEAAWEGGEGAGRQAENAGRGRA